MARQHGSLRKDNDGQPTGAYTYTGEVQAIAFTDTPATTLITIPGRDYIVWATNACHVVFGPAGVHAASATAQDRCWPIAGSLLPQRVYVPDHFDTTQDGTGSLYVSIVRNASNGTLYIAQGLPHESARTSYVTSSSTTTTTTSTTTTSTTTTSTTT